MTDIFRRNFDFETTGIVSTMPSAAARSEVELQLKLEAARLEGIEIGKQEGRKEAEAAYHKALEDGATQERAAIREQLAHLLAKESRTRAQLEREIVEMFLGISERLIPELLDTHAVDLAVGVVRQNLEKARGQKKLQVHACPDVAEMLNRESMDWLYGETSGVDISVTSDTNMARGAVQIEWDGGRLEYDLDAACTAISTALQNATSKLTPQGDKEG